MSGFTAEDEDDDEEEEDEDVHTTAAAAPSDLFCSSAFIRAHSF